VHPTAVCAFSSVLRGWKLVPAKWRDLISPQAS